LKVVVHGLVALGDLQPGDTFMQAENAPGEPVEAQAVYLVLKDGPPRKDPIEVLICILHTGQVLRWPPKTKVREVSAKVVV
jgi:hypothetical protein